MKKSGKWINIVLIWMLIITSFIVGNPVFASSNLSHNNLSHNNLSHNNSAIDILLNAGISQEDAEQLGNMQGAIANMILNRLVSEDEVKDIVRYHIENEPTELPFDSDTGKYSHIPFEQLGDKISTEPSRNIVGYSGSHYLAISNSTNPYDPTRGFHCATGNLSLPSSITLPNWGSSQKNFPYVGLAIHQPVGLCEAGLIYIANSATTGVWRPYIFSRFPNGDSLVIDDYYSFSASNISSTLMSLDILDYGMNQRRLRLRGYNGSNVLFNYYSSYLPIDFTGFAGGSQVIRTTGVMRTDNSNTNTGVSVSSAIWTNMQIGSTDGWGYVSGFGPWDIIRGYCDEVNDGGKSGSVIVNSTSLYTIDNISFSY